MKKTLLLLSALLLTLGSANAAPFNATISRDYDLGFESVIKKKFTDIIRFSKLFDNKNDDIFYSKGYKPVYMLSIKELYNFAPVTIKNNIEKRAVPNTYNLSIKNATATGQNETSLSDKTQEEMINIETIEHNGDFNKIKSRYQKVLAQNPNRIELLYKYAQFLYSNSKYNEAIAVLNDITQKDSGFVLASYTLGNIYFDMGEYKNAIKANLAVIKRNPYCSDAYFNIASALEKMHKFNLAIDYYQKCLSINANDNQAKNAIRRLSELTYNQE